MSAMTAGPQTQFLLRRVFELLQAGRPGAARPLLTALRRMGPASPLQTELDARLSLAEGSPQQALKVLDAGIAASPDDAGLRRCRAQVRLTEGDPVGAATDAADAVILDPADYVGKAMLGIVMLEIGRTAEALACLREAAHANPDDPSICLALARALEAEGLTEDAEALLQSAIAAAPGLADLRGAAIIGRIRRNDFTTALSLAEAAERTGAVDACVYGLKGHALSSLGRHDEAALAYHQAWKLAPEDTYVRHLVAASGLLPGAARAPVDYVRPVFDGYADRFEDHLISLGYRVPGLIRAKLLSWRPGLGSGETCGPVLDLGCGTGLFGVVMCDAALRPLVGVDLSPRMLEQAAPKQVYDRLHETDIESFLASDTETWRVITASDTLCYFGDLGTVFDLVRARLADDGVFVFSLEDHRTVDGQVPGPAPDRAPGPASGPASGSVFGPVSGREGQSDVGPLYPASGWRLGRAGRYMHCYDYVVAAAAKAGFAIHSLDREVLRTEGGAPVAGLIAVLGRAA